MGNPYLGSMNFEASLRNFATNMSYLGLPLLDARSWPDHLPCRFVAPGRPPAHVQHGRFPYHSYAPVMNIVHKGGAAG